MLWKNEVKVYQMQKHVNAVDLENERLRRRNELLMLSSKGLEKGAAALRERLAEAARELGDERANGTRLALSDEMRKP